LNFDEIFGLSLASIEPSEQEPVPGDVADLVAERKEARESKNWALSDDLRSRIQDLGFDVIDDGDEQILQKKR